MLEMDREAHAEDEPRRGTGLVDAFKILSKVPYERQLSLTFKLGDSLAEELVHAMSLICLGKRSEALNKLQALGDNNIIAKHLAEKMRMCGVKLEALTVSIGPFQECTLGTLADLARIFKVLAEERLCDSSLRDLAYQTALATYKQKTVVKRVQNHNTYKWSCLDRRLRGSAGLRLRKQLGGRVSLSSPCQGFAPSSHCTKGAQLYKYQAFLTR